MNHTPLEPLDPESLDAEPLDPSTTPETKITLSPLARWTYLGIGWLFLILGAIGAFLPIMPTVPFLLVTAWAWSKSSETLHTWLYSHKIYDPYLIAWDKYGVIPRSAKAMALIAMTGGWLFVTIWIAESWVLPVVLGLIHLSVGAYIVTRPSAPPAATAADTPAHNDKEGKPI